MTLKREKRELLSEFEKEALQSLMTQDLHKGKSVKQIKKKAMRVYK